MQERQQTKETTRAERLVAVLKDRRWHTTKELARAVSHTFGGAVYRLRANGYVIRREPHPTKAYQSQYRLTELPPASPKT